MTDTINAGPCHRHRGLNVFDLVKIHREKHPEAAALLALGRKPLTYGRLGDLIDKVIQTLNSLGLGCRDRIAIVLPNGPEMAAAFLSIAAGATAAPLNPGYSLDEFRFYLEDLNAKALIVQAGIDSPARQAAREKEILQIEIQPELDAEAGRFTFSRSSNSPLIDTKGTASGSGDVALILHTSGTTSKPKIVPLTGANICISADNIRNTLNLGVNDRCLNIMPLFHIHGLIGAVLASMAAGASIVCSSGFDSTQFFKWIDEFRPTWYTAVPTMHQAILHMAEGHDRIIRKCPLRFIRSCSATMPIQSMRGIEEQFNVPIIESYGMTEASHQMTSNPLPPGVRKPGSVGLPAGPEVAVMDETDNFLLPDEEGEIVIRGENVTHSYENHPEANRASFSRGWFRTGDQGFIDNDGYLFLTGRIKELINRGGEKIAPKEVDEAVMDHPAVALAVTFAVFHPTLGEDVAVAVVLKKKATTNEQELRSFAFSRLAAVKVPSQVIIVDDIPKGPTGKLQRIGLSEMLASKIKSTYVAPRNAVEENLAKIWAEVLKVKRVGVFDNFFRVGGDSLLATQVVTRIHATYQIEIPLVYIFKDPVLSGQAAYITDRVLREIEKMSEDEAQRISRGTEQ